MKIESPICLSSFYLFLFLHSPFVENFKTIFKINDGHLPGDTVNQNVLPTSTAARIFSGQNLTEETWKQRAIIDEDELWPLVMSAAEWDKVLVFGPSPRPHRCNSFFLRQIPRLLPPPPTIQTKRIKIESKARGKVR